MGACTSKLPPIEQTSFDSACYDYDSLIYESISTTNEQLFTHTLKPDTLTSCTCIKDLFKIHEVVGKGSTSCVMRATKNSSGKCCVLKKMKDCNAFMNELELLSLISHDNIIKLEGGYFDGNHYYICFDYCRGGHLLNATRKLRYFPENLASNVIRSILNAIAFCHEQNIVHLDLKLENIMFDKEGDNKIVIIDWGYSSVIDDDKIYNRFTGSRNYLPPESMRRRFGWELKKHDIFTIGIITFALITGKFPFIVRNLSDIVHQSKATIEWNQSSIPTISPTARNFIECLLDQNTQTRFTVEQALNHPWITQNSF